MPFYSISEETKYKSIADQIVMREAEIFSYDLNITNYNAILANNPDGDWPTNIAQYQNATLDQVPDDLDEIVSQYQFRDKIRYLIKTERAERAKSYGVYQALLTLLPEDQKDTLMAEAVARMNARVNGG